MVMSIGAVIRKKELRKERSLLGLCVTCGENPAVKWNMCQEHYVKYVLNRKKNKEKSKFHKNNAR